MKTTPEDLYFQMKKLSVEVRKDLLRKGIVVPTKNTDGTITIGNFTIVKNLDGSYAILDHTDDRIVDNINLPQTAIMVANKLALGHYKDSILLDVDRRYGSADFEERLYRRAMSRKSNDFISVHVTKYEIAKHKKNGYRESINRSFEKLLKLV
jgi:hypothetical protein